MGPESSLNDSPSRPYRRRAGNVKAGRAFLVGLFQALPIGPACERVTELIRPAELVRAFQSCGSAPPGRRDSGAASRKADFRSVPRGGHERNQEILSRFKNMKSFGESWEDFLILVVTTPLGRVEVGIACCGPVAPPLRRGRSASCTARTNPLGQINSFTRS